MNFTLGSVEARRAWKFTSAAGQTPSRSFFWSCVLYLFLFQSPVFSQNCTDNRTNSFERNSDATASFGSAIALGEKQLFVGAPQSGADSAITGAVHIFALEDSAFLASILPSDLDGIQGFGSDLILTDDAIIVGSYSGWSDYDGNIAEYDRVSRELRTIYENPNSGKENNFGNSIDTNDDILVVGAPGSPAYREKSEVYLFERGSGKLLGQISTPRTEGLGYFGYSVAIEGNRVFASDPQNDTVDIFDISSKSHVMKIEIPEFSFIARFGWYIDVNETYLAVAAPTFDVEETSVGAVFVFDVNSYELLYRIDNPRPDGQDWFGRPIILDGDKLIIGAPQARHALNCSGEVYVYSLSDGGLEFGIKTPDQATNDLFGVSLAASSGLVAAGAPDKDGASLREGFVQVFNGDNGQVLNEFTSGEVK